MNTDIHFSSKETEWQTPKLLYEYLDREFQFTMDVACTLKNCLAPHGLYIDDKWDGLKDDWYFQCVDVLDRNPVCFMNPPYARGENAKWLKKAYEESNKGVTTVCLLPARPDTKWFMDWCTKGEIWFLEGRLKFFDPNNIKYNKDGSIRLDPAPFPSCIVIFGPDIVPYTLYWHGSRNKFNPK